MQRSGLTIALAILVMLPVVVILALGIRLARREHDAAVQHTHDLLLAQLRDQDRILAGILEERERLATEALSDIQSIADLRQLWNHPLFEAAFLLDAHGRMLSPDREQMQLSRREQAFLQRTRELFESGELLRAAGSSESRNPSAQGWTAWFWHDGVRLLYTQQQADGGLLGIELNRARLLADVIAALPESGPPSADGENRTIALTDSSGTIIYQWGQFRPGENDAAAASMDATTPLQTWQWVIHVPPELKPGSQTATQQFVVLIVTVCAAIVLVAAAWLIHREVGRRMRDAATRVSFVNRVSHELRGPLTNICLYAELLQDRLTGDDDIGQQYSGNIARESRRLGRLITNVLTFAQHRRNTLEVHPRPVAPDELVRTIVEEARPGLENQGLETVLELTFDSTAQVDPDALQQIMFNLLSNAAKYAAAGGRVLISSKREDESLVLTVRDWGPGIAPEVRERIFDPFYRTSNALSDGVSGTGIGLVIARQLAELHQGTLKAVPCADGACFELRLPKQAQKAERTRPKREDSCG